MIIYRWDYSYTDLWIYSLHYRDGSRLTGLLIVALNLYQRARIEQEVDIVLELKLARRSRPQFVADDVSVLLLHTVFLHKKLMVYRTTLSKLWFLARVNHLKKITSPFPQIWLWSLNNSSPKISSYIQKKTKKVN